MNQDVFPTVTFKTHLEGVSLPVAVFHQQQAARPERGEGFARHRDKVFESFWSVRGRGGGVDMVTLVVVLMVGDPVGIHEARHQRRDRLEVADLDGKPFVLGFADIGRIADQQVEGRGAEKRTGEVGADGLEALPDVVAHRVLPVPRSANRTCSPQPFSACSTRCSVSGRGMSVAGVTRKSLP